MSDIHKKGRKKGGKNKLKTTIYDYGDTYEKYIILNDDDPILTPIVLKSPSPPDPRLVDGFGLPKEDQFFKRREVPVKFKLIEKRAQLLVEKKFSSSKFSGYLVQKEFWNIIEQERENLEEELLWLKQTWWFLRYGYWFWNYGKMTWITPWHFQYLNFYYIDEAGCYPEYRDRDRRAEVAAWYAYTSTETFKNVDEEGKALSFEMTDVGRRVFFGTIEPKRRRGGATARSINHGVWILNNNKSAYCDIVADTAGHSEGIFREKLAPAWYHFPLVLKPIWNGEDRPSKSIELINPKSTAKEACLGSVFSYTESSSERANDSRRLSYILSDEEGKGAARADVSARWNINKLTMAQTLHIHGYSDHPSTVEEMKDGGDDYKSMAEMSNFYTRNSSGQTISGLMRLFFKCFDCADYFVDRWGFSVSYEPTEAQIKYAPKDAAFVNPVQGSYRAIKSELDQLLNDGSYEKLKKYRQELRKKPFFYSDCWRGTAGDMGFDLIEIDKAIAKITDKSTIRGNFKWENNVRDSRVVFERNPSGRWNVSDLFLERANKWKLTNSVHIDPSSGKRIVVKAPSNPLITTTGVDPFRSRTSSQVKQSDYGENSALSDGGIAVMLNYDPIAEGDKPESDWSTPRFICTYRNRSNIEDYFEDALITAIYFGSPVIGERNTETMIDYFIKRGYAGYLLYLMDANGKVADQPWVFSGGVNNAPKTDMINYTAQHISLHAKNEVHYDLLKEWKDLGAPEDYHKKDLAASAGWAIYGYYKGYQKRMTRMENKKVIDLTYSWMKPKMV